MEFNLSELSIQFNLTELTAVKNLVAMVTMEHEQVKPAV
jgi:hypothetical protein